MDSLSVFEQSISVTDAAGSKYEFSYDLSTGNIAVLLEEGVVMDSLLLCYQTFPFALNHTFRNRSLAEEYDSMAYFRDNRVKASPAFDFREEVFSSDKLTQSGSLMRGISFGNAQNVFVNSSLNLQMDGELAENLNIRASITDQNVPFQPEGNSQQIQDFDNVLIELYNDRFNLSGGDVVLQQRKSQFLRYYKNVQGLQFTTDYLPNEKWKASSQVGMAIAKGKFASVELEIREGVMGPYRIRGAGNERFVIVMANSERVFLDGKQLRRGFNQDYIIDYNQGEITFTPQVVITQYSRVRIDFEYAERNFSRSILTANHIQESERATVYINYYREKDDRNRPLFFELSDADKRLLSSVGDNLGLAVTPRIDSIPFDPNRILYRKVLEYSPEGELRTFFEHSTDPENAFFAVGFLEVGPNQGDYRRRQQLANGVVYEYVPPVNGMPQGNFTIQSPLPVPNKRQMITAGAEIKLGTHERLYTEIAFSDTDDNLFSALDNENNKGFAVKSGLVSERRPLGWMKGYNLDSKVELEYNSVNFAFIDRLRYIEFDRDWGLTPDKLETAHYERIGVLETKMEKNRDEQLAYSLSVRQRGDLLSGMQQTALLNQRLGSRVFFRNEGFSLASRVGELNNEWYRYQGELSYRSAVLVPGYKLHVDRNTVSNAERDSVLSTAMNFLEHQFFVRSNDTLNYSFFAQASWREDQFPVAGELVPDTRAFTNQYGFQKRMGTHDLRSTFTYRRLEHLMRTLPTEYTVMGKLDYLASFFKNNLRNEIGYALGNGRELRREFVFLPVPTGEGTHTWRDDNGDGIQQLNEFYLAVNPEEKNFIKIFVPTDDYIQAYTTLYNHRVNAKFPDSWRAANGWKAFFYKFSNTTNWTIEKKITSSDLTSRISPFLGRVVTEELVSARENFRSSFFYNRSSAKFGADFSVFNSLHKQLLSGGYEELQHQDNRLNTRYTFNKQLNLMVLVSRGSRQAASDFLDNRNYRIQQRTIGPELAVQPSSIFRSSIKYSHTGKVNSANTEINEEATLHQLALTMRYAKAIKTTLNSQLSYTHIKYNGIPNSPTGYEMMQALTVGGNYVWNINWLQKIGEGLQLTVVYEGRNSEGLTRVIHTGRMQVTALF
ncbi:hypothetical protein ADIS_4521 [Lunatimonas lonarensis]|uniref:Uncharacterized protein n=1 Tax=Lunatimonas lonarensis TaxID=1232681 RepID=R7ZLT1_9BACT|nr:hypothetical protein ADIS_4521 [Lunatimonas lonarensis]